MPHHARKNAARSHQEVSGLNRRAALQDIRDALPPARESRRAALAPDAVDDIVPKELLALVHDHCRRSGRHLNEAVGLGRSHADLPSEWRRLVLYALTDALAHTHLLVGTLAAYLQQQGVDDDLIRRYLQSPDPDRYITQDALDHLSGLMGHPVPDGELESTWHFIGRQIAQHTGNDQPPQ
ncbi:hypothetical protein [Streptomyces lunaelactis]|uniref:hypothetical protein n=1 Tax=Streptomyces lunaelactis TaxID=1535768 RepID=UPI00158523F8|nr:hypothetical protein [Streptomyces lunaelactis]NUK23490.1 hypothetical protein [Streptomyces lunaelactis]